MQSRIFVLLAMPLALLTTAALAVPADYTDAAGNGNWSNPSSWIQNSGYPGLNDPADTALIDNGTTTVDVDVPLMGSITVNSPGKLYALRTLNNANTVTVNGGATAEFRGEYWSIVRYYWNVILNDGATWYGNLHQDSQMRGAITAAENATVTIRHNGATYYTAKLHGSITAPRSATINLVGNAYNNFMQFHGDNTNLLADVNIECPLEIYQAAGLGTNATGGTIRVLPHGQISSYRWDGASSINITRDFTFLGGNAGGRTHNNRSITYSGQFTLQADMGFIVATKDWETGRVEVSGRITEDAAPRKFNFSTSGSLAASGKLYLSNAANDFSGGLGVATGNLYISQPGAQGLGPIDMSSNGKLYFDANPNASWTIDNDMGGVGSIQVEDGTTAYTLIAAGGTVQPGTGPASAGILQVKSNLAFARDGGTPATLAIDVVGTGSPLVVTSDQLAVTGSASGLADARVVVSMTGIVNESDVEGRSFTILTCANDLTGLSFAEVVSPAGWSAAVTCDNGRVLLQLGKERPSMQLVPSLLEFRGKPGELPAAQDVQVRNIAFGSLAWTASVRAPAPAWLNLTNASGTDNDSFTVSVNRQMVPVGTHTAFIDVTDPNAANDPQSLLVVLHALPETVASTHSFTNSATLGTHPGTVTATTTSVVANLSALPAGTQVYRAILNVGASGNYADSSRSTYPLQIESLDAPGVWLATVGPRHRTLDCTAAAQRALLAGDSTLRIRIVSPLSGFMGSSVRVDVWCDQPIPGAIEQVTGLQAVHRTGDTMLTYREVEQPFTSSTISGAQYDAGNSSINATNQIRYRIYRHDQPIDAQTIRDAELVDEIGALSGWNTEYSQAGWSGRILPMLPVADMTLAEVGTGIYVHRARADGTSYYAVSRTVDGAEDLSRWIPGYNTVDAGVGEAVGPGMVLQWKQVGPVTFDYVNDVMKHYFVKWECQPDTYRLPSVPHNYLVAVPPVTVDVRPVTVALHCWGGSMEDGYGLWRENASGSLLVATHEIPYDWWTAFHENTGTIRPWIDVDGNGGGRVRNYSQQRIWSFVENFVNGHWAVDMNRVVVQGESMGGSGASMWGIRAAEKFACIFSKVGVHIPAESPGFVSSFINSYGQVAWGCLYGETGMSAFDYWDSDRWLREHVADDTPFITFSNGKNDSSIGWNQAWKYARALQETRRPHVWAWGMEGHGQGFTVPGPGGDPQLVRNKTLPAFTYCSLDNDPGNGDPTDGDSTGGLNRYLWWQQSDSTDTADTWEMTCLLIGSAPQPTCTVDVTPRNCQAFRPQPGTVCNWSNTDLVGGTVIASGTATVDADGLVTLGQVTVGKGGNRIAITAPGSLPGDVNGDGHVNAIDLLAMARSWASFAGDDEYDPRCDFNNDGAINALDLLTMAKNWNQ